MTLKYTNRFGDTYFLQVGSTRTGKPNYYCGRKITGTPLDEVPKGYEIHESPESGQVFVRRALCSAITRDERQMVEDGIRRFAGLKHSLVDVEKDSLVVYLPGMSESEADRVVEQLCGPLGSSRRAQEGRERLISCSQYTKMLRFVLIDAERHLFTVERWCFLGSIDGWISVGGARPLPLLVEEFAQHLGKESFYELM